jgi:hypothetical protein
MAGYCVAGVDLLPPQPTNDSASAQSARVETPNLMLMRTPVALQDTHVWFFTQLFFE